MENGLDLLIKGGPLMVALLFCSVLALAMIVERGFYLRTGKLLRLDILREVEIDIKKRNLPQALERCQQEDAPMVRVALVALINADKSKNDLKEAIEVAGKQEVPRLERYLTTLHTIAVISPLIGLLGTVLGMIQVFDTLVLQGVGNIALLAGGISQALITTASGISLAIPVLFFVNHFSKKVENLTVEMERHALTLHELLSHDYGEE